MSIVTIFLKGKKIFIKNLPKILTGFGITAMVGGGVWACFKTLELPGVKEIIKADISEVKETYKKEDPDYKKELTKAYGRAVWKIAKLYSLPILTVIAGIVSILASDGIMTSREIAAVAAAAIADERYQALKRNTEEKYGTEELNNLKVGVDKDILEKPVLDKNGNPKVKKDGTPKTIEEEVLGVKWPGHSPFALMFDQFNFCPNSWEPCPEYSIQYLIGLERNLDDKLRASDCRIIDLRTMLNDMGYRWKKDGEKIVDKLWDISKDYGVVYDPDHTIYPDYHGDSFVSLGITKLQRPATKEEIEAREAFMNGMIDGIIIDPNVSYIGNLIK